MNLSIKRILLLSLVLVSLSGLFFAAHGGDVSNSSKPDIELKDGLIHPKVFEMVEGWISDTSDPIATEVNLSAVENAHNQFNYESIKKHGKWIIYYPEEGGCLQYEVMVREGNVCTIIYASNGGGTLTCDYNIKFELAYRNLQINGKDETIKVMRVLSMKMIIHPER